MNLYLFRSCGKGEPLAPTAPNHKASNLGGSCSNPAGRASFPPKKNLKEILRIDC
jgi:hypothetical protein